MAAIIGFAVSVAGASFGDTNFVHELNRRWAQHDATNLLAFVETSAATNPCLETLTAKGIVYGFVLTWGSAATNLFEEASSLVQTSANPRYSETERTGVRDCTMALRESFVSIAALGGGVLDDHPTTNDVYIAELFELFPDKPPFANHIELFSSLGTRTK